MSDHTTAIVPIESWCYMSPELLRSGKKIDIGLFAEALIYYERLLVIPTNEVMFTEFVSWFVEQGKYDDMLALLRDGILNFYHYAFASSAVKLPDGKYTAMNIQDQEQATVPTFEKRFLSKNRLETILPHARQRARLYRDISGRVIEVKAEALGSFIFNAQDDFHDPNRAALLVQAFVDEVYPMLGLKDVPQVTVSVVKKGNDHITTWNINFKQLSQSLGKNLNFHDSMPLIGQIHCNRLLWSAANLGCDLYLHSPISMLVGDKLYESNERIIRPHSIIDQLVTEVEFPNIRHLINSGQIGLNEVLELRKKAELFRRWLQDESGRDRNAIIAYHTEVAKASGWIRGARKVIRLFGSIGAPVLGAAAGATISGANGAIIGTVVGASVSEGMKFIIDLASKMNEDWRPVVFGNWVQDRISRILTKQ